MGLFDYCLQCNAGKRCHEADTAPSTCTCMCDGAHHGELYRKQQRKEATARRTTKTQKKVQPNCSCVGNRQLVKEAERLHRDIKRNQHATGRDKRIAKDWLDHVRVQQKSAEGSDTARKHTQYERALADVQETLQRRERREQEAEQEAAKARAREAEEARAAAQRQGTRDREPQRQEAAIRGRPDQGDTEVSASDCSCGMSCWWSFTSRRDCVCSCGGEYHGGGRAVGRLAAKAAVGVFKLIKLVVLQLLVPAIYLLATKVAKPVAEQLWEDIQAVWAWVSGQLAFSDPFEDEPVVSDEPASDAVLDVEVIFEASEPLDSDDQSEEPQRVTPIALPTYSDSTRAAWTQQLLLDLEQRDPELYERVKVKAAGSGE